MLFDSLTFKNFFTFYEEQNLNFDLSGNCLTVIIAPNNTGKTCVIRSLEYLLYGKSQIPAKRIVNDRKRREANVGDNMLESSVSGVFHNGEKKYCLTRTIYWECVRQGEVSICEERSQLITYGEEEDHINNDKNSITRIINRIVPPEMFNFFFFKGEELANSLLVKNHNIPDGLKSMLYQDKWQDVEETLRTIKKTIDKEISSSNAKNKKLVQCQQDIETYTKRSQQTGLHLQKLKDDKLVFERKQGELQAQRDTLLEKKVPGVKGELERLRQRLRNSERKYNELEGKIKRHSGDKLFKLLFSNKTQKVCDYLDRMNEKKLLPQDISEELLGGVLRDDVCICGADCSEGTSNRVKIIALKEASFAKAISEKLYTLRSFLSSEENRYDQFKGILSETCQTHHSLEEDLIELDREITQIKQDIRNKEADYDPDVDTKIASLAQEIGEIERQVKNINRSIMGAENQLKQQEEKVKGFEYILSKELQKLDKNDLTVSEDSLTKKMLDLVEKSEKAMSLNFHKFLKQEVGLIYDKAATDSTVSDIDNNTLLPFIKNTGGEKVHALGGGQQQVLVISYIIALSKLRKSINETLHTLFNAKILSEQCFFMDSVYAPMEKHYRLAVSKALPNTCRQLCLLVSTEQWGPGIEKAFGKHVTNVYFFKLHSSKTRADIGSSTKAQYKGQEFELYHELGEGENDYTTINSI